MSWFRRQKENITTSREEQIHAPDGLWSQCPSCRKPTLGKELAENQYVCPHCEHHYRIGSQAYFEILFDEGRFDELFGQLRSGDPLEFRDTKSYADRLRSTEKSSGLNDAMRTAVGPVMGRKVVVCCMDFGFIGGSMGSVVGEKIARAVDHCLEHRLPLLIISKSGGARMMEGTLSLMQMAKTSAKLAQLSQAKLPFLSLMTDPTTGGVTASYAMLGDLNLAEPGALIGFAGPRVIRETIGRDLPEGFQRSEFLLEHGFLDQIVNRRHLRARVAHLLHLLLPETVPNRVNPA